jgi:alkylation response protein AidB-like acyl-CoA dehydrogenase
MIPPRPADLGPELAMFAGVVEEITARHIMPAAAAIDRSGMIDPSVIQLLAASELLVAGLPADAGGGGGGDMAAVLVVERLAAASAAVAVVVANSHICGLMAPELIGRLTDNQDVALARSTRGEIRVGSDAKRTTLNGRSQRVEVHARPATLVVVGERLGDRLVVSVPAAAVEWLEPVGRTGMRGIITHAVAFDDVAIEPHARVGGAEAARAGLRLERLLGAAICCGIARAAITEATRYLDERRQFGRRLSEFASLRAMVAKMAVDVAGAIALTFEAAGRKAGDAAAQAAAAATASAVSTAIDAVQLHGGYGWTTEYPVERLMRDAATARARLGGTRGMAEPIAAELLAAG